MRICFVWTESFKNLQNFGISLSNDFTYTYDHNRRLVTRTAKPPLPKLLFGENISDITGLLGINGSGKSNTLELICLALKANTLNGRHLIVFETEEGLCYINATGTEISLSFPLHKNRTMTACEIWMSSIFRMYLTKTSSTLGAYWISR